MKNTKWLGVIVLCLLFGGCFESIKGSGVPLVEKREVGPFRSLVLDGSFAVKITCGMESSFEISGDDNIVPLVKTLIRGDGLRIFIDEKVSPDLELEVVLGTESLESLVSNGANSILLSNVSGANLDMELNGAGSITASGWTDNLSVCLSGAGSMNCSALEAKSVDVSLNGAASADVYASEELKAQINGVGSITYGGHPKKVEKSISGLGSLNAK